MKHHIREHMHFIELRFRLDLGLKITRRSKKLTEIVFRVGYEIQFVGGSVRDIDDLQEPSVGKAFARAREVENSKVQRRFQRESHAQPAGVWFDVDFYFIESPSSLQSGNRVLHFRAGVRFTRSLLHQRLQGLDGNLRVRDQ